MTLRHCGGCVTGTWAVPASLHSLRNACVAFVLHFLYSLLRPLSLLSLVVLVPVLVDVMVDEAAAALSASLASLR